MSSQKSTNIPNTIEMIPSVEMGQSTITMDENEAIEIPYRWVTRNSPNMIDESDEMPQPIKDFNWEEPNFQSTQYPMDNCTVISVPSKDDSIDAESSFESNQLDTPLDYRMDWTDHNQNGHRNCSDRDSCTLRIEADMLMTDDCIGGFDCIDYDMMRLSEEPLDKEEAESLSIWMKSIESTDIWT